MPSMPLLDYRNGLQDTSKWVMYSDHLTVESLDYILEKNFFLCALKYASFHDSKISSVFQKCDLTAAKFKRCIFTDKFMIIDCVMKGVIFEDCVFDSEEQLIFLKMLCVEIINCKVKD